MRVLVISQWFPPEPVKLILDLAQSIGEFDHSVEVLTGFPNYPTGTLYPGYRLRLWQRERIGAVRVTRVPLYPEHSRSSIRRALNYLSFAASASLLAPFLIRRPDVVFVYGSPYTTAIPARVLKLIWKSPFVFDVPDLWPDTLASTGMLSPRLKTAVQRYAQWVYRHAGAVLAVSHGFAERIVASGVAREKVHMISNWVDTEHYRPLPVDYELAQRLGLEGHFVVMYAGSIGRPQGLESVIEAAALLRRDERIRFVFVGDGTDLPLLRERADSLKLENVLFLGQYPDAEMPRMYSVADALLVHLNATPELSMTVPHKLFAYMASGKPIISGVTGETAALVSEFKLGATCEPGNPVAIAETVRRVAGTIPRELAEWGSNGRRVACERYSRRYLVGKIVEVLEATSLHFRASSRRA
jgi:colanic acid biosynthesis glycosyl transferase WcaI